MIKTGSIISPARAFKANDALVAYERLKVIFAVWQKCQDDYDLLNIRNILALDKGSDALNAVRAARDQCLRDSALDIENLLSRSEKGEALLPEIDRGNLRQFREIFAMLPETAEAEACAKTLEGANDRFWEIKGKIDKIYVPMTRYQQRLDAQDKPPTNRQKNHLAHYEARLREASAIAFQEVKELMMPQIEAKRRMLAKSSEKLGVSPSEVALREWDPGANERDIQRRFDSVRAAYPVLVQKADNFSTDCKNILPLPKVTLAKQERLLRRLRDEIIGAGGFDSQRMEHEGIQSYLKLSTGLGACGGTSRENYITAYAETRNPMVGIMYICHESGHLLYMLGLTEIDPAYHDQPVGRTNGYGMDEVSAMTMDILTSRRRFFELAAPIIRQELGVEGPEWEAENLYRLAQRKESTDWSAGGIECLPEVAWRDKARRVLYDPTISVSDAIDMIPNIWAGTMTEYTGKPHNPADFSFEEDHWVTDMIGSFEGYQAGAEGAAVIDRIVCARGFRPENAFTLHDLFKPYTDVLREYIYLKGRIYPPGEMIKRALASEGLDVYPGPEAWLQRLGVIAETSMSPVRKHAPSLS